MKVYLKPDIDSRGIYRVYYALCDYAPGIEITDKLEKADLVILHVVGRRDACQRRIDRLIDRKIPYVMIQYCLRSTQKPHTRFWIEMWENAKFVWSYYDLNKLCRDDGTSGKFWLYHSPLGVDRNVFKPPTIDRYLGINKEVKLLKNYVIFTCSQHYLTESVKECVLAARRVGKKIFHLGYNLRRGNDITCKTGITDKELADYYSQCEYVSGLRRTEGFELPVVEGLLCGARPIVFDRHHYRAWFSDLAVFIKEEKRENVVNSLEKVFRSDYLPVTKSDIDIARERFDWGKILGEFWRMVLV